MHGYRMPTAWSDLYPLTENGYHYEFTEENLRDDDLPAVTSDEMKRVLRELGLNLTLNEDLIRKVFSLLQRPQVATPFESNPEAFQLFPYKTTNSLASSFGKSSYAHRVAVEAMGLLQTPLTQIATDLLRKYPDHNWFYTFPVAALQSCVGCVDPSKSPVMGPGVEGFRKDAEIAASDIIPEKLCRESAEMLNLVDVFEGLIQHDDPLVEDLVDDILGESRFTSVDYAFTLAGIAASADDPYALLGLFSTYNMYYSASQEVLDHLRGLDLPDVNKAMHAARDLPLSVPEDLLAF